MEGPSDKEQAKENTIEDAEFEQVLKRKLTDFKDKFQIEFIINFPCEEDMQSDFIFEENNLMEVVDGFMMMGERSED